MIVAALVSTTLRVAVMLQVHSQMQMGPLHERKTNAIILSDSSFIIDWVPSVYEMSVYTIKHIVYLHLLPPTLICSLCSENISPMCCDDVLSFPSLDILVSFTEYHKHLKIVFHGCVRTRYKEGIVL